LGNVRSRRTRRCVMQLEYEIGSFRDELGRSVDVESLRAETGIEFSEDVIPFLDGVLTENVTLGFDLIGLARNGLLHPSRSRRTHPDLSVVKPLWIAWPHLCSGDPHVLLKVGLHEHVLIVDGAAGRQFESLRHLDDEVRFDVPAVLEGQSNWGIALL